MIDAPRILESIWGRNTPNREEKMFCHALDQTSRDHCAEPSIEPSQHGVSISTLAELKSRPLIWETLNDSRHAPFLDSLSSHCWWPNGWCGLPTFQAPKVCHHFVAVSASQPVKHPIAQSLLSSSFLALPLPFLFTEANRSLVTSRRWGLVVRRLGE